MRRSRGDSSHDPLTSHPTRRESRLLRGSALLLGALLLCGGCDGHGSRAGAGSAEAARLAGARDEAYVGDQACVACHADVVAMYARTNHGTSIVPFDPATAPERFPDAGSADRWSNGDAWVRSRTDSLLYRAEVRNGRLVQREIRLGEDGRPTQELEVGIDRVIGSGNKTRSYLLETNGRITQMPLTWFAQQRHWDLSPGYQEANDRFSRPIGLQCLACHGDLPARVEHTQNVYERMPGPISCERCHGPAREHVEQRTAGSRPADGGPDPWIVTPTRLTRERELSVCAQCHLAGVFAYPDREDATTFRPGMSLALNRAVYVPDQQLTDPDWVGIDSHPIRLARSACFQATEMTCTTCHLPHTDEDEVPANHYANRCVTCHSGEPANHSAVAGATASTRSGTLCSRPGIDTPEEARSGDCVSCHMSSGGTSDVPHVLFTDHWIRRRPGPPRDPGTAQTFIDSEQPVALVEVSSMGAAMRPELLEHRSAAERSSLQAAALFHFYETMHRHRAYIPRVAALGRQAERERGRGTMEGRLALARSLLEMDSVPAAEAVLRTVISDAPDDPWGHLLLGALLDERRRSPGEAIPHLQRAVALQPRLNEARIKLAATLFAAGRAGDARAELERVVAEDPLHSSASWFNLGLMRMQARDVAGAEAAFREAARLNPARADAWIQLGTIRLGAGDLPEAERAFRAAIAAAPGDPGAHGSLAVALLQSGREAEGRARLQRVLELEPGNAAANTLLRQLDGR